MSSSLAKPARRSAKPRRPIKRRAAKGKRTSKRRKARKARLKDADKLFSIFIRNRGGWQCKKCGSAFMPQCAHIVSRRYRAVRFDPLNAVVLCGRHHQMWTYDPIGWEDQVEEWFPGRLAGLKLKARLGVAKLDYDDVCATLREMVAAQEGRA